MSRSSNSAAQVLWTDNISPAGFFHEKVLEAQERQNVKLTENVEFYIVNLLCEFVTLNKSDDEDCLALILKKALESPHGEQVLLFKRLGDTALYFSGFFQEYFNRKCFDVSYYMTMGENAYGQLASLMRRKATGNVAEVYDEMSKGFSRAVDILLDVSEHTAQAENPRDTLSIYDAWLGTASQKLEKDLRKRGVYPIKSSKKMMQ